jgi:hypothetical protein
MVSIPLLEGKGPVVIGEPTPNWALEPTRSGRPRLAAPGHPFKLSFRGQPRPASTVGSAQR